ncbi:MAG: ArsR family transcriptional regulator [Chloroflexota bacterium]|nr:ArsR family transcriptional regulator [Chloroflexota bacterium]
MQATRERILNILKERDQVTVDELSQELDLTAVTVRHHLDILRGEGLVSAPLVRRGKGPGRPKHIFTLTEQASAFFPKKYGHLASMILGEVQACLPPDEVDQMMKRIGERIASQADLPDENNLEVRLAATTEFLDELGYMARWERGDDDKDYLLHIANCPYEHVAHQHKEICKMDWTLLTSLLGTVPQRVSWAAQGDHQCTYLIRPPDET